MQQTAFSLGFFPSTPEYGGKFLSEIQLIFYGLQGVSFQKTDLITTVLV
jgi:hypothetical protein